MNIKFENDILKRGVSGIMRVKNDAEFIEASIDSCIDALDELIIVYNDCSDNSPELIEKKKHQYPDKIKVYEYKHKIYSINLTKEEYEYAKSLPNDSPHLLCNYYNFALSKVSYKYAMKIDADQIYFSDKLKNLCNLFRNTKSSYSIKVLLGSIIYFIYRVIGKLSYMTNFYFPVYNKFFGRFLKQFYIEYVEYTIYRENCSVSLSGVDIYKEGNETFVTLGLKNDIINILPPLNGVGDHLIFNVSSKTFYDVYDCSYYRTLRSDSYSLIERFVEPKRKVLPVGTYWYHLNAMRNNVRSKVYNVKCAYPNSFMPIHQYILCDFNNDLLAQIDNKMLSASNLMLTQWLHAFDIDDIYKYINLLRDIK